MERPLMVGCGVCSVTYEINVSEEGYEAWRQGMPIERALPALTTDQRNLLMSGTCGDCYQRHWGQS